MLHFKDTVLFLSVSSCQDWFYIMKHLEGEGIDVSDKIRRDRIDRNIEMNKAVDK